MKPSLKTRTAAAALALAAFCAAPPAANAQVKEGKYTEMGANALEGTDNPYLARYVGHAFNWHEWNMETLKKKAKTGKSVFIDFTHPTCGDCAALLENILSDHGTAAKFNASYVSILLDVEERPDISLFYRAYALIEGNDAHLPFVAFLGNNLTPGYANNYVTMSRLGMTLKLLTGIFSLAADTIPEVSMGGPLPEELVKKLHDVNAGDDTVFGDTSLAPPAEKAKTIGADDPRTGAILAARAALAGDGEDDATQAVDEMLQMFRYPAQKSVTAQNALMIETLSRTGEKRHIDAAAATADFMLANVRREDGGLNRLFIVKDKKAYRDGFLDDYAYLSRALLALHRATGKQGYLDEAKKLVAHAETHFAGDGGAFYFTPDTVEDIPLRIYTGGDYRDLPQPNMVMAHIYMDLYDIENDGKWLPKARDVIAAFGKSARAEPARHASWFDALARYRGFNSR